MRGQAEAAAMPGHKGEKIRIRVSGAGAWPGRDGQTRLSRSWRSGDDQVGLTPYDNRGLGPSCQSFNSLPIFLTVSRVP